MNNGDSNKDRTKWKTYRTSPPRRIRLRADLVSLPKTVNKNKFVIH